MAIDTCLEGLAKCASALCITWVYIFLYAYMSYIVIFTCIALVTDFKIRNILNPLLMFCCVALFILVVFAGLSY